MDNKQSEKFKVNVGLRQECIMSLAFIAFVYRWVNEEVNAKVMGKRVGLEYNGHE